MICFLQLWNLQSKPTIKTYNQQLQTDPAVFNDPALWGAQGEPAGSLKTAVVGLRVGGFRHSRPYCYYTRVAVYSAPVG